MAETKTERLFELIRRKLVVRPRDLEHARIPRTYLNRIAERGQLQRIERGLYTAEFLPASEHISLLEVSRRVPKGVICLLSALNFHKIGTQVPHEVWIAIDVKGWEPRVTSPAVRVVRFSGKALHFGIQDKQVRGGKIRVFNAAKTIADCFKFRNKIGLDVALEALRDSYRQKKATMTQLWEAAEVCRVANVMRPYLESLR
ncbi:MAG TPA: type IV toxin-antitoxin system AbiEi family antitoxin domain-containing protein [Terriglobales bacterium]|nr:type IV toxin-antitoxin system AbiEi family antitoxin domain-containing protein [Terriglobales bacterium]